MPDIDAMLKGARDAMTVSRVFGEPIERDGATIIPVAEIKGYAGGGGDTEQNGGGGFTVRARPVGVFVVRGDTVEWKPAYDLGKLLSALTLISVLVLVRRCKRRRSCCGGSCCRKR